MTGLLEVFGSFCVSWPSVIVRTNAAHMAV